MSSPLVVPASWSELSLSNVRPPCRGGHASCISNDGAVLLVFGGCDPFGIASNEMHVVSLQTGRTELVSAASNTAAAPPARSGACLVTLPSPDGAGAPGDIRVLLFGGAAFLPSETVFDDVWIGTVKRSGAFRGGEGPSSTVTWSKIAVSSDVAAPARHSFASCLCSVAASGPHLLFVFGGSGRGSAPLAQPMLLDVTAVVVPGGGSSASWSAVETASPLSPCEMCSACFSPALSTVFLAGGRGREVSVPDLFAMRFPSQSSRGQLRRIASCPALQRTCASLALVSERGAEAATLALIGGVSDDSVISAFPLDVAIDVVAVASPSAAVKALAVRPIPRLDTNGFAGVALGIGQSLASFRVASGDGDAAEFVTAAVSGVFPNAMGHTAQVFVSVGRQM